MSRNGYLKLVTLLLFIFIILAETSLFDCLSVEFYLLYNFVDWGISFSSSGEIKLRYQNLLDFIRNVNREFTNYGNLWQLRTLN